MRQFASKRLGLTGLLAGAAVSAVVWAGDETPPPYPSISPVLPAVLPPTPPKDEEIKPVVGQFPAPVVPLPTVSSPTVPTPTLIPLTPSLPVVPNVDVPKLETIAAPATATPAVPLIPPAVEIKPTKPADLPKTVSAEKLATPGVTAAAASTDPVLKPKTEKPRPPGTVSVSIGATPGVLDNSGKFEAMLSDAKAAYLKVYDYSCHFIRQERVKGKLTAEVVYELHARSSPASIYTKAVQPKEAAGVEVVAVAGRFATNQVRFKPSGGTFVTLSAEDPKVATGRHPADRVGIAAVIAAVGKQVSTERKLGNATTVSIMDFTYAGKPVVRYELLCDTPHAHRASHRTVVYIDKETKLPVRYEAYDEPRGGSASGDLLESYSFVNVKLNVGHAAAVFDR